MKQNTLNQKIQKAILPLSFHELIPSAATYGRKTDIALGIIFSLIVYQIINLLIPGI